MTQFHDKVILQASHLLSVMDEHSLGVIDPAISAASQQLYKTLNEREDDDGVKVLRTSVGVNVPPANIGRDTFAEPEPDPQRDFFQALMENRVYINVWAQGSWGITVEQKR